MENIKTLEELFIRQYEEKSAEVEHLKTALEGAKHTLEELQKANAEVWSHIKPKLRKATAYDEYIIEFYNIWEKTDVELFPSAIKLFGFEEEYKKARQEDVEE